jgi:hypothetical protein
MTTDIDLNKRISELRDEDKIVIEALDSFDALSQSFIEDIAREYKVDDSVAVANLKKSAAVIMATLIMWVVNRGER